MNDNWHYSLGMLTVAMMLLFCIGVLRILSDLWAVYIRWYRRKRNAKILSREQLREQENLEILKRAEEILREELGPEGMLAVELSPEQCKAIKNKITCTKNVATGASENKEA